MKADKDVTSLRSSQGNRTTLGVQNAKFIEVIQALQAQACDNGCATYNDANGRYLRTEHTRACKQARAILSKVAAKP